MKGLKRFRWLLALIAVMAVAMSACSSKSNQEPNGSTAGNTAGSQQQQSAPKRGGTLTVGLDADPATLDPYRWNLVIERSVLHAVYETFVNYDLKNNLELTNTGALDSWQVSADGNTYTLKLWPTLKFADGTPATAEDAKWSLEKARETTAVRTAPLLTLMDKVEVVDPQTLKVTMKSPDVLFADTLVDVWLVKKGTSDEDLAVNPNGTGPFKLIKRDRAQQLVLERSPYYHFDGKPYLDKLIFKIIPDETVRLLQLKNGQIDMLELFPLPSLAELQQNPQIQVFRVPDAQSATIMYMNISTVNPPFDDKRVRQALSYALDRKQISQSLFGVIDPRPWSIAAGSPLFASGQTDYSQRDVAKAKQLLEAAGKPNPEFELLYWPNFELNIASQLMQKSLGEAGFKVNLKSVEIGQYVNQVLTKPYKFQAGLTYISPKPNPYDQLNHPYGKTNGAGAQYATVNPGFYEKVNAARGMASPEDYKKAVAELQRIANEDQPGIVVGGKVNMLAAYKYVKGFTIHPQQRLIFTDVWMDK